MRTKVLLISLSVLLLIPNFIKMDINGEAVYNKTERFNPRLAHIQSIDDLEKYVDDYAASQFVSIYSEKYSALLAYVISCRFYHGFSHFKMSENWIAAVGEKCFGYGLASKVDADDILQYSYAACSQQAIVMMAILRRKNISYRKVGFPHHYAIEAKIADHWYYFDPDMEPSISLSERAHENWNGNNDNLKKYYTKHGNVNWTFGNGVKAAFGKINEVPGKNISMLQGCTKFMSKIAWCIPLIFAFARKRRRITTMYAVKPLNLVSRSENLAPVFPLKYYF